MINLTIPGKPMGKQRPKFARVGAFTKSYTPKNTVNYETLVKELFIMNHPDHVPIDGPVIMELTIWQQIPKSMSQVKIKATKLGLLRPTTKPDIDNVIKIICDALNGLAYVDDNRIVHLTANKFYSDKPRVLVTIKEGVPV